MKDIKIIILLIIFLSISVQSYPFYYTDGKGNEYICSINYPDRTASISIHSLKTPNLEVPSVVIDTLIYYDWNNDGLPVRIPKSYNVNSISSILTNSLISVTLPTSVKEISANAFSNCKSLIHIDMPGVVNIGTCAFNDCESLTTINMPNAENIANSSFQGCCSLAYISMPNAENIGYMAFRECTKLTNVYIPNVKNIDKYAFYGCSSLANIYMHNIKNIGSEAFKNCISLTDLYIPNVRNIKEGTFCNCHSLRSVYMPNAENIEQHAFQYCSLLESIYLSNTIKIGRKAFESIHLKKIYINNTLPPTADYSSFYFGIYDIANLYIPETAIEIYKNTYPWSNFYNMSTIMYNYAYTDFFESGKRSEKNLKGVTADGKTQLLIVAKKLWDNISVNDFSIVTKIDGEIISDKKLVGEIGKLQYFNNGEMGFVYTAPDGYAGVKNSNSYNLDIEISSHSGQHNLYARVEIWRPGVLLLHGLNSDLTCWSDAYTYLLESGMYTPSQLVNYSYKSSNTSSFDENTHLNKVVGKGVAQLYAYLHSNGILSSKYDIVGHSMGGILARKYAQEVNSDGVNRIITFNTPHSGSQGGNLIKNFLLASSNNISSTLLKLYAEGKCPAIYDLSIDSKAIKILNDPSNIIKAQGIPVHAACTAFKEINILTSLVYSAINASVLPFWITGLMFDNRDDGFIKKLLQDEQHDGVVSLVSQRGGLAIGTSASILTDKYSVFFGILSNAHHCNMTHWNKNHERLVTLLQASKDDFRFAKSFSPENLSNSTLNVTSIDKKILTRNSKGQSLDSNITISVERQSEDSRDVTVKISSSKDVVNLGAFCIIDKDRIILNNYEAESIFSIPADFIGTLEFVGVGYTTGEEWLTDVTTLEFNDQIVPSYIRIEDSDPLMILSNESIEPQVIAFWPTGEQTLVDADFRIIDGDGVVEIIDGVLTGINEGECTLEAKYRDITDKITITVQKEDLSGIDCVTASTNSCMKMYKRNSKIAVKLSEYYTGSLDFKVYTLDGHIIARNIVDGVFSEGEEIMFNLPKCNESLLIISCSKEDGEEAIMKILN